MEPKIDYETDADLDREAKEAAYHERQPGAEAISDAWLGGADPETLAKLWQEVRHG